MAAGSPLTRARPPQPSAPRSPGSHSQQEPLALQQEVEEVVQVDLEVALVEVVSVVLVDVIQVFLEVVDMEVGSVVPALPSVLATPSSLGVSVRSQSWARS